VGFRKQTNSVRESFSSHRFDQVSYTHQVHQAEEAAAVSPAGWLASSLLFGIPALTFAFLFHWVGPSLLRQTSSWWRIFHLLLILPLALMLIASLIGAAIDVRSTSWKALMQRLRLSSPNRTAWIWAAALSGFMYGGNWQDLFAVAASWFALWKENHRQIWGFGAILMGTLLKRGAGMLRPALQSIRFFDARFYHEFFGHFGPKDFMGIPLHGAWWILVYYAVVILVCNIGGEELWWRGYVLPRQELAFGRATWVMHGILWSVFHLFMQPTLGDTVRMAITGIALAFVAQRTKSTWPGILGHSFGNLAFFLNLCKGVVSP
jgi:membrane protease YdiL (CAAX protease family)